MKDYSEMLIEIAEKSKQVHQELLKQNWQMAERFADQMVVQAQTLRMFCYMNKEDGKNASGGNKQRPAKDS